MRGIFNGRRVVGLTAVAILLYILWRGPERFYVESFGTWILSPSIYVRMLPEPLNNWLLSGLVHRSWIRNVLCAVPVLLVMAAMIAGAHSLRKNSMPYALASMVLFGTVFSVYHYMQPMGITLVYFD